jgi:Flp pilus assembly protein TadB
VTDEARSRLASFAGDVRGPASGAYAFGVVLPLALAGMLPAARAAGAPVDIRHVVVLYDIALPLVLLAASGWLVLQRPVAFPPPQVPRSHPDRPSRRLLAPATGIVCGIAGWLLGVVAIGAWAGYVAALGFGGGAILLVAYRPVATIREQIRDVEAGLDDALYLVGRRVATGESVERAVATAADELPGATGTTFEEAVGVSRRLRVGVRASFLGEHGALATVPSQRARGAAALLAIAASEGRPAGAAIVSLADHLTELRRIERESRRELATITSTLANTAALFGPLVGGATVALAGRMATAVEAGGSTTAAAGVAGAAGTTAIGPSELGVAVGGYVLATAVVLTALAATLERGFDRALVGYRVGIALPSATATYLATYVGVALVL